MSTEESGYNILQGSVVNQDTSTGDSGETTTAAATGDGGVVMREDKPGLNIPCSYSSPMTSPVDVLTPIDIIYTRGSFFFV